MPNQPGQCDQGFHDVRVVLGAAAVLGGGCVVGVAAAIAVVRLRRRYVMPPRIANPEADAWRERRLHHDGA